MPSRPDRTARSHDPEEPAGESWADPEVQQLLSRPRATVREVPRARQIFVNRNLRMDRIDLVGFDMDYTLAIYQLRHLEELAFRMTLERLVALGYPRELATLQYDPDFMIRGVVVDKLAGNVFKMDRHNHVGRCYHGRRPLGWEERKRLYRDEKIHLSLAARFAWIDTLFAIPEACLFAEIIDRLEGVGATIDYARLYDDIRESIDTVHRDNSLKTVVKGDLAKYLVKDRELGPALHRLRSGGKKLFLLTNSLWDYTDVVMRWILDGMLPEYPSWKNYFDVILTGAAKPGFFSEQRRPIVELGPAGERVGEARTLERGRIYEGGNLGELERLAGIGGERVLYVGDHIYGDILRSKKSSLWRTCMVVQELEGEIAWLERSGHELEELARLEDLRARLGDEVAARKSGLNVIERKIQRNGTPARDAERLQLKHELEILRRADRDAGARVLALQHAVEDGLNRWWGLMFKEGNENSRFGEQIEDYACLYTSRVSNLVHYSPMQYFRSPRAAMPHERGMIPMAPWGDDHAAPAAADRPSKTTSVDASEVR